MYSKEISRRLGGGRRAIQGGIYLRKGICRRSPLLVQLRGAGAADLPSMNSFTVFLHHSFTSIHSIVVHSNLRSLIQALTASSFRGP